MLHACGTERILDFTQIVLLLVQLELSEDLLLRRGDLVGVESQNVVLVVVDFGEPVQEGFLVVGLIPV